MKGSATFDLAAVIDRAGDSAARRTSAAFMDGPPNSITPGDSAARAEVGLLTVAVTLALTIDEAT